MSRTFMRTLAIAIVCIVALLAGTTLAAARANHAVPWASSDSAPVITQSGPDSGSPTGTPANSSDAGIPAGTQPGGSIGAQDPNGNESPNAEAPGSEGSEAGGQNANEANDASEQKMVGSVASINTNNATFTLNTAAGSVVLAVTSQTEFEDGLVGLSSLHQGMSVRVDSVSQGAGHVVATKVKGPSSDGASEHSDGSDSNP